MQEQATLVPPLSLITPPIGPDISVRVQMQASHILPHHNSSSL